MKNKIFFLLLSALLVASSAKAQKKCGTPTTPPTSLRPEEMADERSETSASGTYLVQIFVHILRDFDGSNAAISQSDLQLRLQTMADYYQPHNICFAFIGQDFIDHTGWNRYYDTDDIGDLASVNPHPNAIDIYVHKNCFIDDGDTVCGGMAYNIPAGKFSVVGNATEVYEHEMGHCLGLYHTFETDFGVECPSGENSAWAGDIITDTPADYNGDVNNCVYTGNASAPCLSVLPPNYAWYPYNPLPNNIMSYYSYTNCAGAFTAKQADRMRDRMNSVGFLHASLAPENLDLSGQTLQNEVGFAAENIISTGNIAGAGNFILNGGVHGAFNAGNLVHLLPGTYISPSGSDSVILKINDLCSSGSTLANDQSDNRTESTSKKTEEHGENWLVAPNPFSGSTSLTYALAEPSRLGIFVFRTTGELVATLLPETLQEAGGYRVEFNAKDLPAGVYFLVIQKNGERTTKQLILTR